jgi:hypothetical protein
MSDLNDLVFLLDKKQNDPATKKVCGNNPDHGGLGVHGSGSAMLCTAKGCDYVEMVSRLDTR